MSGGSGTRRIQRVVLGLCALLLVLPIGLGAQDIDDLFQTPDAVDIEESPAEDASVDPFSISEKEPIRIKGLVDIEGGGGFGLQYWPSDSESFDFDDAFEAELGYSFASSLAITVEPVEYFRFYADIEISLDQAKFSFPPPRVNELFVDYTLAKTLLFRIGKQNLTWGIGRLLGNPGNLVSRVEDGIGIKIFAPVGAAGLTAVVYAKESFFQGTVSGHPSAFGYAALFESSTQFLTWGLSAHFQKLEDLAADIYLKTVLGPVDIGLETRVDVDVMAAAEGNPADPRFRGLFSAFWEGGNPKLSVIAEYLFDSEVPDWTGHRVGVGLALSGLPWGGWRPGLTWNHAFEDGSGQVVLGFEGPLAPSMRATLGLPVVYGRAGSYYRENSLDSSGRVLGLTFAISLSMNF